MSVMTVRQERRVLPRKSLDEFWEFLREHYAEADPVRWRYLAMLCLRENSNWTVEQIACAFGHDKGHVSRCLHTVKRQLRSQFAPPADVLSREDEGFSDPDVEEEVGECGGRGVWE